jgi:hypothetical protein
MDRGKTIVFVSHSPEAVRTLCRRTCVLDHGELSFDGDVESGLAFYGHLLAHQGAAAGPPPVIAAREAVADNGAGSSPQDIAEAADDWTFEFLRREGLHQGHRVLHVGDRAHGGAGGWRTFLEEHNYVWVANTAGLLELDEAQMFDFAVVESLFVTLPFNGVARCIAAALRKLKPSGRLYATWFENPDPSSFDPILRASGVTTYADGTPYHYPFGLITNVCDAVGATVHRVPGATSADGESVLVIARR